VAPNRGDLNLSITGARAGIHGFGVRDVALSLSGQLQQVGISASANATLELPNGFPNVPLAGTLATTGFNLSRSLPLKLGGLFSKLNSDSKVTLNTVDGVVKVGGDFETGFGSLNFQGNIDRNGTFALVTANNGSLSIGGKSFSFANGLSLAQTGLSGSGKVRLGNMVANMNLSVPAGGAVSYSGSASGQTGWKWFGPANSHPAAKADWTCAVSLSGNSLSASATGNLTIEWFSAPKVTSTSTVTRTATVNSDGTVNWTTDSRYQGINSWRFDLSN